MDPQRAYNLGVRADECNIQARTGYRGAAWTVYFDGRPVTQFASQDVFSACQWVARLRRIEAEYAEAREALYRRLDNA
jgi:hypothetical protein